MPLGILDLPRAMLSLPSQSSALFLWNTKATTAKHRQPCQPRIVDRLGTHHPHAAAALPSYNAALHVNEQLIRAVSLPVISVTDRARCWVEGARTNQEHE